MKTKYVYILMLGLLSVFSTGCEDRLDIAKHGNMGSQEDFYKTDDDAIQALASLYSSWGGNYYNWFFTKNLLADDVWAGGGSRGDNSQMEQLNEYTFDTDHGMVQGLYSGMYGIIYKSNLIIDLLGRIRKSRNVLLPKPGFSVHGRILNWSLCLVRLRWWTIC